jgi:serine/threonine protein phosphatase PrpC
MTAATSDLPVLPATPGPLNVRADGMTVRGIARERNEDSIVIDSAGRFFVIADGIGGEARGDEASRIACAVLREEFDSIVNRYCLAQNTTGFESGSGSNPCLNPCSPDNDICCAIRNSFQTANDAISHQQECRPCRKMGTTAVAVVVIGNSLFVGNIGDSRAYLIRDSVARQLTSDHSLTAGMVAAGLLTPEDAVGHPYRNVLYKALGVSPDNESADVECLDVRRGDCLVLASDGVTDCLSEDKIAAVCDQFADPQLIASELIRCSVANGSTDDATDIVAFLD